MRHVVESVIRMAESKHDFVVWCFFFFSSRRRHTRWNCDWSSDVCSSDLARVKKQRRGLGRVAVQRDKRAVREVEVDPLTALSASAGVEADAEQRPDGKPERDEPTSSHRSWVEASASASVSRRLPWALRPPSASAWALRAAWPQPAKLS